ncbi:MAG: hypothetical protein RMJ28_06115 [Nitrososphaerota archaeon]|nr:hypothetical protein [Candidatus Calditenuaceae archaeon]MDW8073789.1 hypothetical protein [Nitrososphaerota archaeon]
MSDPAEEFREISRRIFESVLTEEEVEELAYRWASLKARLASGAEEPKPRREEVDYLKRRIYELRVLAGLDSPPREG